MTTRGEVEAARKALAEKGGVPYKEVRKRLVFGSSLPPWPRCTCGHVYANHAGNGGRCKVNSHPGWRCACQKYEAQK